MNDFYVYAYEIDNCFPTLTVSSFEPNSLIDYSNYIEPVANDISSTFSPSSSSEEEPIQQNVACQIGICGEYIAKKYLENQNFKNVNNRSTEYSLGYDLQADEFQVEVKTTIKEINCFEISINELNKMDQNKEISYLFFIKIRKDSVFGWLILNPIDQFTFPLESLKSIFANDNISVDSTKVRITIIEDFLKTQDIIDLSSYLPEEGEDGYKEWILVKRNLKF